MDTADIQAPIQRRDGVTTAERYLKRLSDRSFLSLWSYSGVYRDQFDSPTAKIGKEVCDLQVVFQNHIIIFSDKDCAYPTGDDEQVNWQRWFRRAVSNATKQIWSAEKWIKNHPQRLFLDPTCAQRFPFPLPDPATATFHRIVVAHGAAKACRKFFGGGSGSLVMCSDVIGSAHAAKDSKPFTIGQIDPTRGYVHVFDDTSLEIIMRTLDTVTDFVNYLTRKERFITSGKAIFAAGEEEMLAFYLKDIDSDGEHGFIISSDIEVLCIEEGMWEEYLFSPQHRSKIQADEVSYLWDRLIERFNTHILNGTQYYYASHPGIESSEQSMRFLARESRLRRRMLAQILLNMLETTPTTQRRTSVVLPSQPGDPHYVFLLLPHLSSVSYEGYREMRGRFLEACCLITKLMYPEALDIIGIATDANSNFTAGCSNDVMYFDARNWTEEMQEETRSIQHDTGLLTNITKHATTVWEYPYQPESTQRASHASSASPMKGRDRNKPCPCGSGKKFKKCCGK